MDARIIDRGKGMGGSLVRRYLHKQPEVSAALAQADAHVVVFELPIRAADFFAAAQQALDAATAAAPTLPLFVALTFVPALVDAGAYDFSQGRAAFVPLACSRGVFLGYAAIGEGGVVFFDPAGARGWPRPEVVLAALQRR